MTLSELAQGLKSLGYPVAYSHFKSAQTPPFICYLVTGAVTKSADNKPIHKTIDVDIELYIQKKNLTVESKIEKFLQDNELPWDYDEQFIESEGVFKCTYSITLI